MASCRSAQQAVANGKAVKKDKNPTQLCHLRFFTLCLFPWLGLYAFCNSRGGAVPWHPPQLCCHGCDPWRCCFPRQRGHTTRSGQGPFLMCSPRVLNTSRLSWAEDKKRCQPLRSDKRSKQGSKYLNEPLRGCALLMKHPVNEG